MTLDGRANWLADRSEAIYSSQVLRLSKEAAVSGLTKGESFLEIEFPASRANDPTVTGTLDLTRAFVRELISDPYFKRLNDELWILFPDANEAFLARKSWGETVPFVLTSIPGALTDNAKSATPPKVMISVSPGFNVEEWIDLERVSNIFPAAAVVTVNGNLERLRNSYYPPFFYPKLASVTNRFYRKFKQAVFLNPIAVGGDRLGAWLVKVGVESPWEIFVVQRQKQGQAAAAEALECISSTPEEPRPQSAWQLATAKYKQLNNQGLL